MNSDKMERGLRVSVAVSHEALAGVVEYLKSQKIYVYTMSEAVGLGIEMFYKTLVTSGQQRPIATINMAQTIFQVNGLRCQRVEVRGRREVERIQAEQQERVDYYMRVENKSEKVATALVALEALERESSDVGASTDGVRKDSRGIPEPPSKELLDDLRKRGILEGE